MREEIIHADCLTWLNAQSQRSVDLVFGSPPYAEKGTRYIAGDGRTWSTEAWIDWMLDVTGAAVRVSRGYVLWVVNGAVRKGRYLPAVEGLVWEWHKRGGCCERPCIWHKNAPPNRRDWFGNDWEYVVAFKRPGERPYFDWQAVADPPRYTSGGRFRQRSANGRRRLGNEYPQNKLTRPRDVIRATVGGGHLGSRLAHQSEAPFPLKLAEHFIKACCPPGGTVCDPFAGSGTTLHAAILHGRGYVCLDNRESQIELMHQRAAEARNLQTAT